MLVTKQLFFFYNYSQGSTTIHHTDLCKKSDRCENLCAELTILNLWIPDNNCDLDKVSSVIKGFPDDAALLADLNSKLISDPYNMDVIEYLGGIEKHNSTGLITKATAIKVTFINKVSDEYPKEKHEEWEEGYSKFLNNVRYKLYV